MALVALSPKLVARSGVLCGVVCLDWRWRRRCLVGLLGGSLLEALI